MALRAISLNLFGHNADWPARLPALQEGLRRLRPDVLALQEAVVDGTGDQAHVVVGGDFNAAPDAASIRFWTGRQTLDGVSTAYRDCWESVNGYEPGLTFAPANPLSAVDKPGLDRGRRIDYLMVRCGDHGPTLRIAACRRVFDEPVDGVWASDHYGVLADLELPERPVGSWA